VFLMVSKSERRRSIIEIPSLVPFITTVFWLIEVPSAASSLINILQKKDNSCLLKQKNQNL